MRFASKDNRDFYIGLLLSLVADFLLAYVFMLLLARNDGLPFAIIVFIFLEVILAVVYMFRGIFRVGAFFLFWKDNSVTRLFDALVEKRYPMPREFESSPIEYLRYVATNKEFDVDVRIKAAEDVGLLFGTGKIMRIGYNLVFEEALEKYRRYLVDKDVKGV